MMRNLLIVCNPGRVDAVVAAVELQQNLASTLASTQFQMSTFRE
jgi:hypothetical protein